MSGLFGNASTSNGGGLFGASKPATGGSGLFGQPSASTQTSTPSLFASTSQPAAPSSNLFGGALGSTQQPAASGSSLFGGGAASSAQPAASSSNLFGNTSQAQNQSNSGATLGGSLFSSQANTLTNANSNTGLGSGLFGGQNNNNANVSVATPSTQAPQAPLSFQPTKSTYFDQMLERGKKRNHMENSGLGELPSLQLGLADIARKARNLGTGGPSAPDARAGDSRAHYLLASSGVTTANALRDLNNFSAQAGAAAQQQPDSDIDAFVSNLRTQSTMQMIQEGLERSKRDFDDFLEESVQMNWDAQRRKIYEHFGLAAPAGADGPQGAGKSTSGAFGRSTRGKGLGASTNGMSFGASTMQKSVIGNASLRGSLLGGAQTDGQDKGIAPRVFVDDRTSRDRQESYFARVKELNEARNSENCYPVLHQFAAVEREAGETNATAIENAYQALIETVKEQETTLPRNDSRIRSWERRFAKDHLEENSNSQAAVNLRRSIVRGSQTCLEQLFMQKVESTIAKDPKVASLGGIPQPINKIRAYIRVLAQRKNLISAEGQDLDTEILQKLTIDGEPDPVWAIIFFLLRSGLVEDAAKYVAENARALRNFDRNFGRYIEAYAADADRRLTAELRSDIIRDYQGKTKAHDVKLADPYKIACYKIIGRCELSRKTLDRIPTDEEDWIWLQFTLAKEVNRAEESAGEAFGLEQLQSIIKDIGQKHFSQGADNVAASGLYFFLQVLAGLYEQAVAWLYTFNHVAAVHFAIALAYYGLIRVADLTSGELLSYNTRQQARLQFALMVGYYTGTFRAAKPETATDYLVLLSLNADMPGEAGKQQGQLCLDALRELVLETREFAQLLGDIRSDGQRLPGAIQLRASLVRKSATTTNARDLDDFIKQLTVQAAQAADEAGRTTDAVLLYHLAGEFDNVLTIINRTLSEALTVELGQKAMRLEPLKARKEQDPSKPSQALPANSTLSLTSVDDPVILARNMLHLYTGANRQAAYGKLRTTTRETTAILLNMSVAKEQLLQRNFAASMEAIENINIVPLVLGGNVAAIRQYAQNFNNLSPVLARCVGDLLIWAVLACTGQKDKLTREGWENDSRKKAVNDLNVAIADLGVYAGLVRYKLRQGVFEVLAKAGEGNL